jgi:hypothetical protein
VGTQLQLHLFFRFSRKHRYKERDWRVTHQRFIAEWDNRHAQANDDLQDARMTNNPHDQRAFNEYLRWLQRTCRVFLLQPLDTPLVQEDDQEDVTEGYYDYVTRDDTQP